MPHPGSPRTLLVAILVAAPMALASGAVLARSGARVRDLREALTRAERAGDAAAAAVARLEPRAVEAQLAAFDRRREAFADLARERRNRLLGVVGLVAAALAFAGVVLVAGLASDEAEQEQPCDIRSQSAGAGEGRAPSEDR
jgi:hypothetical protein